MHDFRRCVVQSLPRGLPAGQPPPAADLGDPAEPGRRRHPARAGEPPAGRQPPHSDPLPPRSAPFHVTVQRGQSTSAAGVPGQVRPGPVPRRRVRHGQPSLKRISRRPLAHHWRQWPPRLRPAPAASRTGPVTVVDSHTRTHAYILLLGRRTYRQDLSIYLGTATVCLACSFAILSFLSFYNSVDDTNVTMYHHLISQAGWNRCNLSISLSRHDRYILRTHRHPHMNTVYSSSGVSRAFWQRSCNTFGRRRNSLPAVDHVFERGRDEQVLRILPPMSVR